MLLVYSLICLKVILAMPYRRLLQYNEHFQKDLSMEKLYCDITNPADFAFAEGDMFLINNHEEDFYHKRAKRNALSNLDRLWPEGIVYYQFDPSVTYKQRKHMSQAMDMIMSVSCIRFYQRTYETGQYLHIKSGGPRCWSHVGFFGSKRHDIVLGDRCWNDRTVVHELLHSLGFGHEHNRFDRDHYITVNWDNVKEDKRSQFCQNKNGPYKIFDLPYDYNSIMHYYDYGSFAKNSQSPVLYAKTMNVRLGGTQLTSLDICKINLLYKCGTYFCP